MCESETYKKLLTENVTKMYKKASKTDLQEVNCEASKIAKKERFENKMEIFTPSEAYLTIKDHKCDFLTNIL